MIALVQARLISRAFKQTGLCVCFPAPRYSHCLSATPSFQRSSIMPEETSGVDEEEATLGDTEASLEERISAWLNGRTPIIDLREEEEVEALRLQGSVHIRAGDLADCLFELPDPSVHLALLGKEETACEMKNLLQGKGWKVAHTLVASDELWTLAEALGITEAGPLDPRARPILFKPTPFLASVVDTIEQGVAQARRDAGVDGKGPMQACDVGCGSARDAVWLAKRGCWNVRAMDRLPRCLDRGRALARRHGVTQHIEFEAAVIKADQVVSSTAEQPFHRGSFDLVLCVRFLERAFMPTLVTMVGPGGYLLFVSFVDIGEAYEHPKDPKRLLQPGELRSTFGDTLGLNVVSDDVETLPDGRVVSAFLARRPPLGS